MVRGLQTGTEANFDFQLRVQLGQVPGVRIFRGLGERETIQTTATGEDLWRGNELAAAPTSHLLIPTPALAGELMSIDGESAQDVEGGTGAAAVTIEYLDGKGDEQSREFATNGTTVVPLGIPDMSFINDMYVSQLSASNTTGVADGNIFIHNTSTAGLVYNMIAAGGNKSLVPHRRVPRGKTLALQNWVGSEKSGAKRCILRLRADCNNDHPSPTPQSGVFLFKSTLMLDGSAIGLPLGYTVPEMCTVKVSAWASAQPSEAACHWWGYLVDTP